MRAIIAVAFLACMAVAPLIGQRSAPANETPSQFYLRYRAAVPAATTVEQVAEFWSADQRSEFTAARAAERVNLDQIKAMFRTVSGVRVIKESATLNAASVEAAALMDGKAVRATIQLTREKDGWKIASGPEHWR